MSVAARDIGVPETFNAAAYFVDRNVDEGHGSRLAVECGAERLTYGEVLANVNRIGSALRHELGVGPGDRVLLLLHDGPDFIYSFFGAIKIGAVPVPLNTLWRPDDYEFVIADSGAVALVVSEALLHQVARIRNGPGMPLCHIVVSGSATSEPAQLRLADLAGAGSTDLDAAPTRHDAPAFWLYSSGSTGRPKGCVHLQHDMAVCAALYGQRVLGIRADDRTFSVAKLFFAYGLGNALYLPFSVGATTILWPGAPAPQHVYDVIERHRPTLFYSVPTGFGRLLSTERPTGPDYDLSSVRLAVSAGEALPAALYERFKARFGIDILDGIGSTETAHMFISNRPGAIRPGSSGLVVPGYDARLLDDSGQQVAADEIGNLWIRGDSICDRYWNQPEKTADTIVDGWIRTGDKYTQDADGFFWYAGRSDDMLKVGGMWVSPIEIENALIAHPAVLECAVVGREDADRLVKPSAHVVLRAETGGSEALATELRQFVRGRLADYKRPRWVEFVSELPKTATGKLQRYKLRE